MKEVELSDNNKKSVAILACMFITAMVMLSALFIASEQQHKCEGENCPICLCLEVTENTMHQIGAVFIKAFIISILITFTAKLLREEKKFIEERTLVGEKVRLDN